MLTEENSMGENMDVLYEGTLGNEKSRCEAREKQKTCVNSLREETKLKKE